MVALEIGFKLKSLSAVCLLFLLISLSIQENAAQKDLNQLDVENYTSCEQFLENSTFDRNSVIDIDWKIFYFWNPNFEESYNIKFSIPSDVVSIFTILIFINLLILMQSKML